MSILRYLDPRNDLVFKRIFGTDKNKDVLIHFLNDILAKDIVDLSFLNPVLDAELALQKQSIVDVLCTDQRGNIFIVEMQVAKVRGFEKRAQYYAAKAYAGQIKEGEPYHNLKEIIFLAIVDFVMFPKKAGYKSEHIILDKSTFENDLKDFSFTFLELPKFKKNRIEELESYEEKWCYFFKNSDNPEDMERLIKESDQVISKAYQAVLSHNWKEEELRVYEAISKANMDARAREEQVRYEGVERGIAIGMEKAAINMLKKSIDLSIISEVTGLPIEELVNLKSMLENLTGR